MLRTIKILNKILVIIVMLMAFGGCAPMMRINLDTYLQNQEYYKGKDIVFTASLEDVLDRYDLYKGKRIELTAPVTSFGHWKFWTWYLILEKNGKTIRAYESNYRNYPDRYATNLLRFVRSDDGEVTVMGKLQGDGIELDRLSYQDISVNTNFKSYRYYYVYGHNYLY